MAELIHEVYTPIIYSQILNVLTAYEANWS